MSGWTTNGLPALLGSAMTGAELFAADTQLASGQVPQSAAVSSTELSKFLRLQAQNGPNFRNFLDGGDFTVNPWQRGAGPYAGIANIVKYTADRWFAFAASTSAMTVSQQALAAGVLAGFGTALQFGRPSANADLNTLHVAQVLESADCYRAQGDLMTLSFWAQGGATYLSQGGLLTVQLVYGTGVNGSSANLAAGSWTGQAFALNTTQTITGSWTRYQFTTPAVIPASAVQLGVILSYTPTAAAGASDYVNLAGVQLEVGPAATAFEFRDVQVELEICQRYYFQANEPGAGVVVGAGMNTSAAAQLIYIALPVQMRAPPAVSVTAGTFKTNQAGTATATTITQGTTHTVNAISINGNSAGTAGQATLLQGGGGAGLIAATADL
jgi:hypothetical protein